MNKLQMAHQMALAIQGTKLIHDMELVSDMAWKYADAMQAEADKRNQDSRSLTKDENGNCLHFHREFGHKKCMDCGASLDEWQPDWSQAPKDANWWAADKDGQCDWYVDEPKIKGNEWIDDTVFVANAPSFDYQGHWKDSLRKRP